MHLTTEIIFHLWVELIYPVESVHVEQNLHFVSESDDDDCSKDGDEAEGDQGEDAEDVQDLRPGHHHIPSLGGGAGELQVSQVLATGRTAD